MTVREDVLRSSDQSGLVLAAAGSGKTELLTQVLSARLATGEDKPEEHRVVAFTFTRNAADELAVRLSRVLASHSKGHLLSQVYVGTIHGWCNRYLADSGTLANTKVVDELERVQLIQRVYPLLKIDEAYEGPHKFAKIDDFVQDLELYYNENLGPNDRRIPPKIRVAIGKYQEFLEAQRLLDFGQLIRRAIQSITEEQPPLQPFRIYVDEYQDINPAQVALLQAMLNRSPAGKLLAVGDPRQAIYNWRGGDMRRILAFTRDFPGSGLHQMAINRRSRKGMVDTANSISRRMKFPPGSVPLADMEVSHAREDSRVSVVINSSVSEVEWIAGEIRSLIDEGVPPSSIAVLLRSVMYHGKGLLAKFDELGIPFKSPNRNRGTAFVEEFISSVAYLMEQIAHPPVFANRDEQAEHRAHTQECLKKIQVYCSSDLAKIHLSVAEWYRELTLDTDHSRNERYNFREQFFRFVDQVGLRLKVSDEELQEGISAVTQVMQAIEEAYRRRLRAGFNIRSPPYAVFTQNLTWHLQTQVERWTDVGLGVSNVEAVTVSTIHAAKGLEWPVVFIPFLWQRRFPGADAPHGTSYPDELAARYGTTVEDERRLWYVAVTRARDRLYLLGGGNPRSSVSPFLDEIIQNPPDSAEVISSKPPAKSSFSKIESFQRPRYNRIGVSDALLLLECPYQFHLRNEVGLRVPVGPELGAGNIIHNVIRRMQVDPEQSLQQVVDEEVYLPLGETAHESKIKQSVLGRVRKLVASGVLKGVLLSEYAFSFPITNATIDGVIDAVRPNRCAFELLDWKYTLHPEFRNRYENQLRLYAHAMRKLGHTVSRAVIYDLGAEGKTTVEVEVDISPDTIEKLIGAITTATQEVNAGNVGATPNTVSCRICDVRRLCPYAASSDVSTPLARGT